jgi:hypothetical protein
MCRQAIHKGKLRPYVENGVWDGMTHCRDDDPQGHFGMSDGMLLQMKKMVEEGEWGDIKIEPHLHFTGDRYVPSGWSRRQ